MERPVSAFTCGTKGISCRGCQPSNWRDVSVVGMIKPSRQPHCWRTRTSASSSFIIDILSVNVALRLDRKYATIAAAWATLKMANPCRLFRAARDFRHLGEVAGFEERPSDVQNLSSRTDDIAFAAVESLVARPQAYLLIWAIRSRVHP